MKERVFLPVAFRILGHKWFVRFYGQRVEVCEGKQHVVSFSKAKPLNCCARCGVRNPNAVASQQTMMPPIGVAHTLGILATIQGKGGQA
jgi:hypothetical protein